MAYKEIMTGSALSCLISPSPLFAACIKAATAADLQPAPLDALAAAVTFSR